jgi:hypothetical protein
VSAPDHRARIAVLAGAAFQAIADDRTSTIATAAVAVLAGVFIGVAPFSADTRRSGRMV